MSVVVAPRPVAPTHGQVRRRLSKVAGSIGLGGDRFKLPRPASRAPCGHSHRRGLPRAACCRRSIGLGPRLHGERRPRADRRERRCAAVSRACPRGLPLLPDDPGPAWHLRERLPRRRRDPGPPPGAPEPPRRALPGPGGSLRLPFLAGDVMRHGQRSLVANEADQPGHWDPMGFAQVCSCL